MKGLKSNNKLPTFNLSIYLNLFSTVTSIVNKELVSDSYQSKGLQFIFKFL